MPLQDESKRKERFFGNGTFADTMNELTMEKWRGAVGQFLTKVLSTIGGRHVPVVWMSGNDAQHVAYTDGEKVFLNPHKFMDSVTAHILGRNATGAAPTIARLKGAAYHELAHVMYTPRMTAMPCSGVLANLMTQRYLFQAFNILEDCRIENFFGAKYRPARKYFKQMVVDFMLTPQGTDAQTEIALASAWVFMYGRKYLPAALVDAAYTAHCDFINKYGLSVDPDAIKPVIDAYTQCVFPKDGQQAYDLIEVFCQYLTAFYNLPTALPSQFSDWSPSGDHNDNRKGSPSRSEQEEGKRASNDSDGDDDGDFDGDYGDEGDGDDFDGDGDGDGGEGDTDGTDSDGGDGGDSREGDGADTDNDADGSHEGDSDGDPTKSGAAELVRAMEGVRTQVAADTFTEAVSDMKSIASKVNAARRIMKPDLSGSRPSPIDVSMRSASRSIQQAILTLRADREEVWERTQASGRFSVKDAIASRGEHLNVFKRWEDSGDQGNDFEVVILLDQSLSMCGYPQQQVSDATWVIRDAFQSLDIPVTVIGYDTKARLLFSPDDKVSRTVSTVIAAKGSTDATDAIEWAANIFAASTASSKLLFSLTDGQWYVDDVVMGLMRHIKSLGVKTTLIQQGAPTYNYSGEIVGYSFDDVPASKYGHDRVLQMGESKTELPAVVSKAIMEIARTQTV